MHGDIKRYWTGCRCTACSSANTAYASRRRAIDPEAVRIRARLWAESRRVDLNRARRAKALHVRLDSAALVKRQLRAKGALLDELSDTERCHAKFIVYALVDPTSIAVRYVGVSSNGLTRPRAHRLPSHLAREVNRRKDAWITSLAERGTNYAIRILEIFESGDLAHAAEPYWIAWFRSVGEHLYNATAGNDTQIKASDESREKMSRAMKSRIALQGGFTPEHRAAISAGKRRSKR